MNNWPYPAPTDDSAAAHLVPGRGLPDMALGATSGGPINLRHLTGRAVVFVYPWTGRPGVPNPPAWDEIPGAHGSTPEAEGFRDHMSRFDALGVRVLGLSTQTSGWQQELAARLALSYPLLSDAGFHFSDELKLPRFETGGVSYLERLTLVVRDGLIEHVFFPVHPPHTHAAEVLAWLSGQGRS